MVWFRRTKVERSADGSMSLMEHLYELRKRLMWAVIFIVLGTILGFIWFDKSVGPIPSLGTLLIEPLRIALGDENARLLALSPFSGLQLQLKAALMAGLVFSSPGWLYQIWAFVTPALYSKERRYAVSFVTLAALLFTAGAYLAYRVIPEGLRVLFQFGSDSVQNAPGPAEYYSFLMTLLIVFGISFLLPLFIVALNFIGVVKGRQLAKWRRYAIFGMFVFSALVVPGNDPISMLALALSMCLLYEISLQVSKFNDRRKGRNNPEEETLASLSDDQASTI
ncbi:MAG: twin-arginine translocase subunit TatC [Nakamurella sp.]